MATVVAHTTLWNWNKEMRIWLTIVLLAVVIGIEAQTNNDSIWRRLSLPEVMVKVKPVEISRDTVKYNVAAFQDKNDRYIEDVLKKLPGIEVAEDGRISYKGNPINRFNIEGKDLLGNRYNQATRNLPVEAVAQVQVMENDQPIRALKDSKPSDHATLNIKLKSGYKIKLFGEVQGGIGGFEKTIWNNHLTLIRIAKENQMLVTAKMNNRGENINENTINHIDVNDLENYAPMPSDFLTTKAFSFLPISESRHLDNNSYSVGVNHLHGIGEYGNLRTNITYFGTKDEHSDSTFYLYGGAESLALYERNNYVLREHTIEPHFRYELNAPKAYLIDEVSGSLSYKNDRNSLYSNSLRMDEDVTRHPSHLQNKMQMILNSGGHHTYTVNSLTRYFRRSETLNVVDTSEFYNLRERIVHNRIFTRNSIVTSFFVWGNRLELKYGMEYRLDKIKIDIGEYQRSRVLTNTLSPEYDINYGEGLISIGSALTLYSMYVPWYEIDRRQNKLYVSPSIKWRHDFSPFWRMVVRGSYDKAASDDELLSDDYASNYRTRIMPVERIGWHSSTNASLTLNYANLINMVSWNFMASASHRKNDHHNAYTYQEHYTLVSPVWESTESRLYMLRTAAEKTFTDAGTSVKGSVNYTRNETPVAQNDLRQTVKSNIMSTGITLRWNKLKWIHCADEGTFNVSWQDKYELSNSYALKSLFNEMHVSVYPTNTLSIDMKWEQSLVETSQNSYNSNAFIDARVRYTLSRDVEMALMVYNICNRHKYVDASFSGFNYAYYSLPLRGREFMLSVKWKF